MWKIDYVSFREKKGTEHMSLPGPTAKEFSSGFDMTGSRGQDFHHYMSYSPMQAFHKNWYVSTHHVGVECAL